MSDLEANLVACQQAVARKPQAAEAHFALAKAYLDLGRREEAVSCFKQAIALKPDYAEAGYHLGYTYSLLGNFHEAIAWCRKALAIRPDYAEAWNNIGYSFLSLGDMNAAAANFRKAVAVRPDYGRAQFNLGLALLKQGQAAAALPSLQQAVRLQPDLVEGLYNLGLAYLHLDQPRQAAQYLQQAAALKPNEPEIYYNLGYALYRGGDPEAAVACYQKALSLRPDFLEVHYNLGTAYNNLGRNEEAIASLKNAIRLKPDYAEAYSNMGTAFLNLNKINEAIPCFQRALALKPDYLTALYNLGTALGHVYRQDESIAILRRAVAIDPNFTEAHYNLGNSYSDMGRLDEARSSFERTLAIKPDHAPALINLGNVYLYQGMLAKALGYFNEALSLRPDKDLSHNNKLLALNYVYPAAAAELLAAHRRFGAQFETAFKPWPAHTNSRDPERRLKVGYVSADFRLHSVAFFMEPLLAHHDKRAVEVYCYYNHTLQDAVNERLQAHADHWIPCKDLSDAELAARIQADGIDILVDLTGHTRGNRLLVFARKPAPVQVTYLGYPATTGLSAIDYRLVTADTDPPGAEAWHSERLYRLPRSLWCYRPSPDMPAVIPTTAARRNGFITFGAMNNVTKVSDAAIATWARLLKTVPTARLIMTNLTEGARRVMHERFAAHGIAPARFILHGKLPAAEYYALLNTIDIALDPFPYTGTTTTCESLWMGVPVVTLIGETSVARSGYALLKGIGLEELAAGDEKEYVAIAAALAQDLDRLDALRGGMRQRIASSPLRDEAGLTRDLEAAYRAMWRAWCDIS